MNPQKIDGAGTLLKSSWLLFMANWPILTTIAIIPIVTNYISTLLVHSHLIVLSIIGVILAVTAGVLSVVMSAGLINAIHRYSSEQDANVTVLGQYRIGFKYFWSLVLVSIIGGLVTIGSFALFIVPAVIVGIYLSFYMYALVIDGKRGISAFLESYSMVYGRWSTVFGRIFVLGLIMLAGYFVVMILDLMVLYLSGVDIGSLLIQNNQQAPTIVTLAGFIFNLFSQAILGPLAIIYSYKLYQLLKSTRKSDVSVTAFRRWLVAFMIIGPIFFVLFFVVVAFLKI